MTKNRTVLTSTRKNTLLAAWCLYYIEVTLGLIAASGD